jgi:hypothetical protein
MTAALSTPIKPVSITLMGPGHVVMQELCAHVRNGMVVHPDLPVHFYENGNVQAILVQGNPTQAMIDMARQSEQTAREQEAAERQRDIQAEAKRLVEEEKRALLEKQKARIKAEHEKAMRALEAATEAEIAKLAQ